jgi:hypothetical protein
MSGGQGRGVNRWTKGREGSSQMRSISHFWAHN